MNSYLIASVKSIMSDLFRSWPREGLCVYVSRLSQRGMRDVQHRIMAFTYPQRAAYQSCLAQVFDAAEVQMLPCGCWALRKKRISYWKSAVFPLFYFWEEKWQCFFIFFALVFSYCFFSPDYVAYALHTLDKIWSCSSCLEHIIICILKTAKLWFSWLWHSSASDCLCFFFLKGLVNPHIIWHSNGLFTLLLILLNDRHLCSGGPETLPKTPASLGLIYGVINVRLSVDMSAWDNRRAAPKTNSFD